MRLCVVAGHVAWDGLLLRRRPGSGGPDLADRMRLVLAVGHTVRQRARPLRVRRHERQHYSIGRDKWSVMEEINMVAAKNRRKR